MALATPLITVQDGPAAASSPAAGAVVFVTPGNSLTVALASTTGVVAASWRISAPGTNYDGAVYTWSPAVGPAGFTIQLPMAPVVFTITTTVTDGNNPSYNTNILNSFQRSAGVVHRARFVSAANNESLTAFVGVTGGTARDGINGVQGDIVLLAGQTNKSQNGLYMIGVVAANVAPLTRVPDFASGMVVQAGQTCEISEGTLFNNTTWKVTTAGAVTVDTTNHDWFPGRVTQSVTLTTGFVTVTNVPILSTTKTAGIFMPTNFSGASTTVSYRNGSYASGGAATAAGIAGTGSISVTALVAAGTFNTNDVGTGSLTIINW